jgi:spermidine synthase
LQERSDLNTELSSNRGGRDYWFAEYGPDNSAIAIKVKRKVFEKVTPYQRIEILDSYDYGKVMLLDGYVMLTEKDEFIYHEMLVHIPLFTHPEPENILIIGGGDGGAVREAVKHKTVKRIDLVEIDREVVDVARKFLPTISSELENEKVHIYFEDGIEFIKSKRGEYDIIIVDSPDPVGPAVGLFERSFYSNVFLALNDDGIIVAQCESPHIYPELISQVSSIFRDIFPLVKFYLASVPTYVSGIISFAFGSKRFDPVSDFKPERVRESGIEFKYYNEQIHPASFALPNFFKKLIK